MEGLFSALGLGDALGLVSALGLGIDLTLLLGIGDGILFSILYYLAGLDFNFLYAATKFEFLFCIL